MPKSAPVVEEVLDVADIQGNILAGFNKDYQRFLFLRIRDRRATKRWLVALAPCIASTAEVLTYNQLFKTLKRRRGADPAGFVATWINIAFSIDGVRKLTSRKEAAKFGDSSFKLGLPNRAALIGDPSDPHASGNPRHWQFGGEDNGVDIVVIVASDDLLQCDREAERILSEIGVARPKAVDLVYDQSGSTLHNLPGHEHFGFRDGVSQPGVRGRVSAKPTDFLTPRLVRGPGKASRRFGKPGQPLIWPGQFVFGYRRQHSANVATSIGPAKLRPAWTRNGSYLVVRKLVQDVPAFWQFMSSESARIATQRGFGEMTPVRLATLFTGRWPSGAPIARAPLRDNPLLAKDAYANNDFAYLASAGPMRLRAEVRYAGDNFAQCKGDIAGIICPHAAHIRKMNPRDLETDTGGVADTLTHLLLRRGVPFGEPVLDPMKPTDPERRVERGLMFLAYQTSIQRQFEFLMNHWGNSQTQPQTGGPDPLIGQRDVSGNRARLIDLTASGGATVRIKVDREWVRPAGGGYFFAPGLKALTEVLAK